MTLFYISNNMTPALIGLRVHTNLLLFTSDSLIHTVDGIFSVAYHQTDIDRANGYLALLDSAISNLRAQWLLGLSDSIRESAPDTRQYELDMIGIALTIESANINATTVRNTIRLVQEHFNSETTRH